MVECSLLCATYYAYGGETLVPNDLDLQRLQRNDRAMLLWICGVNAKDGISSEDLLAKLHPSDATVELHTHPLRWFGRIKCSNELSFVMDMRIC